MTDILAVNLDSMTALTTDDEVLDITTMYDYYGNETDDKAKAVSVLAGPTNGGHWCATNLSRFVRMRLH